jgi:hypothetical protein
MIYTHRHSKEQCRIIDNEIGLSLAMLKYLVIQGERVAIPSTYILKRDWRDNTDKRLTGVEGDVSEQGKKLLAANKKVEDLTQKLEEALKVAENALTKTKEATKELLKLREVVEERIGPLPPRPPAEQRDHLPDRIGADQVAPQVANQRAQAAQQEEPVNDGPLIQRIATPSEEDIDENSQRVAPK